MYRAGDPRRQQGVDRKAGREAGHVIQVSQAPSDQGTPGGSVEYPTSSSS